LGVAAGILGLTGIFAAATCPFGSMSTKEVLETGAGFAALPFSYAGALALGKAAGAHIERAVTMLVGNANGVVENSLTTGEALGVSSAFLGLTGALAIATCPFDQFSLTKVFETGAAFAAAPPLMVGAAWAGYMSIKKAIHGLMPGG
jgi:hypothetical protein